MENTQLQCIEVPKIRPCRLPRLQHWSGFPCFHSGKNLCISQLLSDTPTEISRLRGVNRIIETMFQGLYQISPLKSERI